MRIWLYFVVASLILLPCVYFCNIYIWLCVIEISCAWRSSMYYYSRSTFGGTVWAERNEKRLLERKAAGNAEEMFLIGKFYTWSAVIEWDGRRSSEFRRFKCTVWCLTSISIKSRGFSGDFFLFCKTENDENRTKVQ